MTAVANGVLRQFPRLNDAQVEAVATIHGPLHIVAGPGSGKSTVLVARALNILLQGAATPDQILLCTFTEKAALDLRDRLYIAARDLHLNGPLSDLKVGTIHGISNDFLMRYRHHSPLGNNYEVLDDLTQLLFLFDHFGAIIGEKSNDLYLNRWKTRWTAIEGARNYFNKITEELVAPDSLTAEKDRFLQKIGRAYCAYSEALLEFNRVDFAHLQKMFFDLLSDPDIAPSIRSQIKFIMVDEYQDTNYVQEQLLLSLAQAHKNICVVGDEDQSLYRFRGATVRNILEFPSHFDGCKEITLNLNYRSHSQIVAAYDAFMNSWDWSNPGGHHDFRFDKEIRTDPDAQFTDYPAVLSIWGQSKQDEAGRLAELVAFLKQSNVIEDESQVAVLLHSVREEHSGPYIRALAEKGIRSFCPRAKTYFDNEEVMFMIACYAVMLGYHGEGRGEVKGRALSAMSDYIDQCIHELAKRHPSPSPLAEALQGFAEEIEQLTDQDTLDRRLADYFYEFLALEPFNAFTREENRARNLAILSQLLNVFQTYYHYNVITARNREPLRFHFFNSFLRLLHDGGINEYEDPDRPFPKGHVQVMTIHQSKGLEFPVVVVGSLANRLSSPKDLDRTLGPFYHRPALEPENRITGFDRMRLHYVAFSRAEKVLVLTTTDDPQPHFSPIWEGLPQWPYVRQDLLGALSFRLRSRMAPKKTFSFTSDLKVFETCPRQYEFFRHYGFIPARSAEMFFGALVHQTIEDIHRRVLEGKSSGLNESAIRGFFDLNFRHLVNLDLRPIGPKQQDEAFRQVMSYFSQNRDDMNRVIETEVDVSLEKDQYILTGKIDLLLGSDNKLELLDFKSQTKPQADDVRLDGYYKQLCIYAHILEERYKKTPDRLLLYWTGEHKREDALMIFEYNPDLVTAAGRHFDQVVAEILSGDFSLTKLPEKRVCKECDLRHYCRL